MTTKESLAADREFAETPIGVAFSKFKSKLLAACALDTQLECTEYSSNLSIERRAKAAWAASDEAERNFVVLLKDIKGANPNG